VVFVFYYIYNKISPVDKLLHLVSFNVPHPADYGGVIDVFYKLKALHGAGAGIILHCFEYGRENAPELEKYCEKVYYYPRNKSFFRLLSTTPFIVNTRNHEDLLRNLAADVRPVLFEGLHSTFFLKHPALSKHKKIVRTHNIEHEYYEYLSRSTDIPKEKYFFRQEAIKLRNYEKVLHHADHILCISEPDTGYFGSKYGRSIYVPAFHPFDRVYSETGTGEYIIFHGNLEVAENIEVVNFLVDKIFTEITYLFYIVGKNPPQKLVDRVQYIPHVNIFSNVSGEVMDVLIRNSHICLIPSFQPTGMKLKLLASLFAGRHCITNSMMVPSASLKKLCTVADTQTEMIAAIEELSEENFTEEAIRLRKEILENEFSNEKNAQKILELL
jgi:glycosyltransferase involved in cell wall biosynthesis